MDITRMSGLESETVEHKRAPRRTKRSKSSRATRPRSAVTSGRQLFISGDPQSAWSRRFHDLVIGHCNDLGGFDVLSDARISLIRRASSIECELERLDALLSTGAAVNLDCYGRAASHLRRILETLGLDRKVRDVTPDGVEIEPFSPMRARWQAEATAATAATEKPVQQSSTLLGVHAEGAAK
jgi:hypothetical protein